VPQLLEAAQYLNPNFPVVGGVVYQPDGVLIKAFGKETPQIGLAEAMKINSKTRKKLENGLRYETACAIGQAIEGLPACQAMMKQVMENWMSNIRPRSLPIQNVFEQKTVLILRFDAEYVQREIRAFILRISGLVLLICAVVTLVTMLVMSYIVLTPILRLRDALLQVGAAPDQFSNHEIDLSHLCLTQKDELGQVMRAFHRMNQKTHQYVRRLQAREAELKQTHAQAEKLLLNILPASIADKLKQGISPIADYYPSATVLFADLVGFTELSGRITPTELVKILNELFTEFDQLAEQHDLEKIKTIGDAYMIVAGVPMPRVDHAQAMADMALDMQAIIQRRMTENACNNLNIRIGMHSGPVLAGVIGIKKFIYDVWGDAVNVASRMESHGVVGEIQVSATTWQILKNQYVFQPKRMISIKGKGEMGTYLLDRRIDSAS
jgi:class 3 adenylate cyclase